VLGGKSFRKPGVQHNTRVAAGRQKVVVKTEEACGFGGSGVMGDGGGGEGDAAKVDGRLANKRADRQRDRRVE
jgi:hypothetical protein